MKTLDKAKELIRALEREDYRTVARMSLEISGRKRSSKSLNTVESYSKAIRDYSEMLTTLELNLYSPPDNVAQLFYDHLKEKMNSNGTIGQKMSALATLYRALGRVSLTKATPFERSKPGFPPVSRSSASREPYSGEELLRVYRSADLRTRTIIVLIGGLGLRISELLNLKWSDIEGGFIRIRPFGKGNPRLVRTEKWVDDLIVRYKQSYGPGGEHYKGRPKSRSSKYAFSFRSPETARYHMKCAFAPVGISFRGFQALRKGASLERFEPKHLGASPVRSHNVHRVYGPKPSPEAKRAK